MTVKAKNITFPPNHPLAKPGFAYFLQWNWLKNRKDFILKIIKLIIASVFIVFWLYITSLPSDSDTYDPADWYQGAMD